MKNKFLLTATLVAALTLATPLVANAAEAEGGSWKCNATGWWYAYADGTYVTNDFCEIGGKTYYFKADGYMATGWQYLPNKGTWYYFDNSGAMMTGWQFINGKWYFFNNNKEDVDYYGAMAQGDICEIDGKEQVFAPSGQWVSGWTWDSYTDPTTGDQSYGWYYAQADGTPYDNNAEEYREGGWLAYNGAWYWINDDGSMETDWVWDYETWEIKYRFKSNGQMISGWYQYGNTVGDWYYCNADGTVYDGWLAYNGAWYYLSNGWMYSNTWVSSANGETRYYLGADGRMVTGWYNTSSQFATGSSSSWIYCNADGSEYTGWVASGGKWYYIEDGEMVADERCHTFNQKEPSWDDENAYNAWLRASNAAPWYIFDGTGAMVTGWYNSKSTKSGQTYYDNWYYADADGKGHNGWLAYKGAWYYIEDGLMLTNCYTPDGYWVGADGVWR